jgi:hypothetical protein
MCEFPKERQATGQWLKGFFFAGSQAIRQSGNQESRSQTRTDIGTYSLALVARAGYDMSRTRLLTGLLDYWIMDY